MDMGIVPLPSCSSPPPAPAAGIVLGAPTLKLARSLSREGGSDGQVL